MSLSITSNNYSPSLGTWKSSYSSCYTPPLGTCASERQALKPPSSRQELGIPSSLLPPAESPSPKRLAPSVGDTIKGTVLMVENHQVWVQFFHFPEGSDLGPWDRGPLDDGFLHINDISYHDTPSHLTTDMFPLGSKVKAKIISTSSLRGNKLSLKEVIREACPAQGNLDEPTCQTQTNGITTCAGLTKPIGIKSRDDIKNRVSVGTPIKGHIICKTTFGYFVRLPNDIIGFLDFAQKKYPKKILKVGQEIKAYIIGIDNLNYPLLSTIKKDYSSSSQKSIPTSVMLAMLQV